MTLTGVQRFRFCHKCQTLFYGGQAEAGAQEGRCPAGGAHEAKGYLFDIPVNAKPSPTAQNLWRVCGNCWAMFYAGYREQQGVCPGKAFGHSQGTRFHYNFALPHDVAGTPDAQTQWRFCNKCVVMFYDGYEGKGRCAAGGAHVAQGYDFVLPHLRP